MICKQCIHNPICKHTNEVVYACEFFKDETIKTEYDRIRNMSVNEMALFLANETYRMAKPVFDLCGYGIELQFIFALRKQWLESEVTE